MTSSPPIRTSRTVTLRDVAELAGVSSATASRALNNSSRPMSATLRQRVIDAATELRYVSNGPAQALARRSTSIVGMIVHDVNDPYYSAIASGAIEVAVADDLLVMMTSAGRDPELEAQYVGRLRAQRARAIILAGGLEDGNNRRLSDEVEAYSELGGRVVAISRRSLQADTIAPANAAGAREVARLLHRLGHRRVGVVTGPPLLVSVQDRIRGFLDEAAKLGIDVDGSQWAEGDFTREGGRAATARMFEASRDLTAVFALNDAMALGAVAALRDDLGLTVPDDVSVVGFDDIPSAMDVTPSLTTVRLPLVDIGRRAMELALDEPTAEPRRVEIPSELIVRASTAEA